MNNVNIIGRITSELTNIPLSTGTSCTKFSIAFNEKISNVEKTYFFNLVSFGKTAEFIANYCKKGGRVGIEGKLQQNTWETKEGQKRQSVEILVQKCSPIDWREKESIDNPIDNPIVNTPEDSPFSADDILF